MSAPTGETDSLQSKSRQLLESCWSCRLISGGGLMLSGAYVFNAARKIMRTGVLMTPGLVAQITFAGCELSFLPFHIPCCRILSNKHHVSVRIFQVWLHGEWLSSRIPLKIRKTPSNPFRNSRLHGRTRQTWTPMHTHDNLFFCWLCGWRPAILDSNDCLN